MTVSLLLCGLLVVTAVTPAAADPAADEFQAGYASAILERELAREHALLGVRDGVIYLDASAVPDATARERIEAALSPIAGVEALRWMDGADGLPAVAPRVPGVRADGYPEGTVFLPERSLFEGPIADPRWPRFYAARQDYRGDAELDAVGAVGLGGEIPLLQGDLFAEGRWEIGLHAGVFSIFDLEQDSLDLVNSDFLVGAPFVLRFGAVSLMARVYHQSSHLGDEYLLRTGTERIDLSYEGVDGLLSIDLAEFARIYGGYGYLVDRDPSDLQPRYVQAGVELESPWALWGFLRPVAALDVQRREENDWRSDYSARAGFQIESGRWPRRRVQILAEYYDGRSPNGQFFERRIEYWGVGIQLQR